MHPADFCWGNPVVSESIIKHRPYRETRFSQNPADFCWGNPIVSESIRKHRPYRETRFSQNPADFCWGNPIVSESIIKHRHTAKHALVKIHWTPPLDTPPPPPPPLGFNYTEHATDDIGPFLELICFTGKSSQLPNLSDLHLFLNVRINFTEFILCHLCFFLGLIYGGCMCTNLLT